MEVAGWPTCRLSWWVVGEPSSPYTPTRLDIDVLSGFAKPVAGLSDACRGLVGRTPGYRHRASTGTVGRVATRAWPAGRRSGSPVSLPTSPRSRPGRSWHGRQ